MDRCRCVTLCISKSAYETHRHAVIPQFSEHYRSKQCNHCSVLVDCLDIHRRHKKHSQNSQIITIKWVTDISSWKMFVTDVCRGYPSTLIRAHLAWLYPKTTDTCSFQPLWPWEDQLGCQCAFRTLSKVPCNCSSSSSSLGFQCWILSHVCLLFSEHQTSIATS